MLEAKEALRGLIDRIVVQPSSTGGRLGIHLEDALAALLMLSLGTERQKGLSGKIQAFSDIEELVLVAGGRIGLCRTSGMLQTGRQKS